MTDAAPKYRSAVRPTLYEEGIEFQDYICMQLARHRGLIIQNLQSRKHQLAVGENLQGAEIKLDRECTRYGRLSLEVAEKAVADPTKPWVPSGIMRPDNSWLYIQGNYEVAFVFAKTWLLNYYRECTPELQDKFGTLRTFYLSLTTARRHAAAVLEFAKCGP